MSKKWTIVIAAAAATVSAAVVSTVAYFRGRELRKQLAAANVPVGAAAAKA